MINQHLKTVLTLILSLTFGSNGFAWPESGHHIISLLAYDQLEAIEQTKLVELLEKHPRYAEDFSPPENIANKLRWRIGVSGYWPDIARSQSKYNRQSWHYQLGANLILGDESKLNVPEKPWDLPNRNLRHQK